MLFTMALVQAGCASGSSGESDVPALEDAQGIVYNASRGTWYDDAGRAFSEAEDDEALYLYDNAKTGSLESSASDLSIDLQGFALSVDAVSSGARGGQGLSHDGIALGLGVYEVSNGDIIVSVGANPETVQSATTTYQGISTGDGSKLTLSGVSLNVTYVGASTIMPAVELAGIGAGGSLAVQDGSTIAVESAPEENSFGASTVAGVRATAASDGSRIVVSDDSAIAVDNRSAQVVQGAIGYPNAIYGTTKKSNAELIEIALDQDSDWYDDLCARFLAAAQFDDQDDADGFVFGAEVYYAPSLELENGLKVWAFSDPVSAGAAGMHKSIAPTHVFVRSDYALALDAYGIWCTEGFAGAVSQDGDVYAATTQGHAIGVYKANTGSYELDEETIEAASGLDTFRSAVGAFDFGDYADVPVGPDVLVAYPRRSTYTAVREEKPAAWKSVVAGDEPRTYETDPIAFEDLFSEWDLHDAEPEDASGSDTTISLSLVYYRMGKNGYLYTSEGAGTYAYTPDLDLIEVANEYIRPDDIVEIGGVQNRFLGWSPRMSDREPLYTDHIYPKAGSAGSFGTKYVLYGLYEPVEEPALAEEAVSTAIDDPVQSTASPQAVSAGDADAGALPRGGLDVDAAQRSEAFSPLGGMILVCGFAFMIMLSCLIWFVRGRKFMALADEASKREPCSRETPRRKGGIRF